MKRIICHWTGGAYSPNLTDKEHYHFIIDNNGIVYTGKFKPENNEKCIKDNYAAHTGGGNTGSIGIAFAGMLGFQNRSNVGKYPLTKKQVEAGFELCAKLIINLSKLITALGKEILKLQVAVKLI
ncbi:MAG: N-acetylmuramoyl-L-alanine amidase [Candidatus Gastranaerophilales bacterium]|nr:N-acetylmuramoyl-L-alanine amidase [Candidatus Gastranaerophilales bacterium]